jgi:pimeloyl-ACP methyl ester carboxylesterase
MPAFRQGPLTFHYLDTGSGFPFVFQHAIGEDVHESDALCTPPEGIRLLSFDGRAQARADHASLTFDDYGDDLIALLDHLRLPKAVVGGVSMGAAIALNVAARYPERVDGLVLSRPAWLEGGVPAYVQDLYGRIARLLGEPGSAPTPVAADWPSSDTAVECLRQAAAIQVPTLVLAYHQDPLHAFHYGVALVRTIRGARFVRLAPYTASRQRHTGEVQRSMTDFLAWFAYSAPSLKEVA